VTRLRFSLILASVELPRFLSEANESRVRKIELAQHGVSNFEAVQEAIENATTREKAHAIITYIIRHTPQIVTEAKKIQLELQKEGHETREAQMQGALTAGVRFLTGNEQFMLADRDRDLRSHYQLIIDLFDSFVRVSGEGFGYRDILLRNVIFSAYFDDKGEFNKCFPIGDIPRACFELAQSLGFIFHRQDPNNLYMFANYRPITNLLSKIDEYVNISYTTKMKSMHNVEYVGRATRIYDFMDAKMPKRPYLFKIRRKALEEIGFFSQKVAAIEDQVTEESLNQTSFDLDEVDDPDLW